MRLGARPVRRASILLPTVLLVPLLAACGGSDDDAGPAPDSRLGDALADLPAEATSVEYVDRVAVATRFGVDDIGPEASEGERADYAAKLTDAPAATELSAYVVQMADAAFSDLDVEWQATVDGPDDLHAQVWRVRDDLDLDAVADDLADAGYTESGSADARRFTADPSSIDSATGLIGGRYPQSMLDVTLLPDEHLVVSGGSADPVVGAATGEDDSLADSGGFDDVVGHADDSADLEYAVLRRDDEACGPGAADAPDPAEAAGSDADLGTATAAGWFTTGDGDDRGVLLFADSDAAESDADQRTTYLSDFSELYGLDVGFDVSRDDDTVLVASDAGDARTVVMMLQRGEGPLACGSA